MAYINCTCIVVFFVVKCLVRTSFKYIISKIIKLPFNNKSMYSCSNVSIGITRYLYISYVILTAIVLRIDISYIEHKYYAVMYFTGFIRKIYTNIVMSCMI